MRRSSTPPADGYPTTTARPTAAVLALCLLVGVFGAGCRSPRPGGAGDTCGRTDDCEAPLRCVQSVCHDPSSRTGVQAATGAKQRPAAARGTLPPLSDVPPADTLVGAPPAGVGGVGPGSQAPVSVEGAVPAAGLPGEH